MAENNTGTYIKWGIITLVAFPMVRATMENLGLWQSKEGKDFDNQQTDPGSFWNPKFWESGPDGTLLLTEASCSWLYNEIYDSFNWYNDDESRIYAAFKALKTQSQLSYFSHWVQTRKGMDLLDWLIGGKYGPVGDHLSAAEVYNITEYISKLPKYKR